MNINYDIVVLGAGNAGLISALKLSKEGKKVLLIDNNSIPGGIATSTLKGQFEFENSLQKLTGMGSDDNKGIVRKIFDEFEINEKIEWIKLTEGYKLIKVGNTKEEYLIPLGVDEFIKKMEEYVPESKDKLSEFFELAKEIYNAMNYVYETNNIDYDYIRKTYPNFANTASYTLETVLKKLKLPTLLEQIITSYWINFGTSSMNLNFAHYISEFYKFIAFGGVIPKNRSFEISSTIEKLIRDSGADIWFNEEIIKINIENNQVKSVITKSGKTIFTNHLICNSSLNNICGKLIDYNSIPKDMIKLTNTRQLGLRAFNLSLGLNKSASELGIKNYMYYVYNSLDSNIELENIKKIDNYTMIITCLNIINPEASKDGTCILNATLYYSDDCYDKIFNETNYLKMEEKIQNKIIEHIENALEINIKEFIEEFNFNTPITYSKYNNANDGCIYGYLESNNDSVLSRVLNKDEESLINGLRVCSSASYYGHSFESTYKNGYEIAIKTLKDIEKGE